MKVKQFVLVLVVLVIHIVAIGFISYTLWPFISWYTGHRPILGVDFYNSASLVRFFSNNFAFPPNYFLDMWYAGTPAFPYAVMMWFFLMSYAAKVWPLIEAIKVSMSLVIILLSFFTYLGAYKLSKNHFLALLIAVLVGFSANLYGALTWGGSLPYFANQIFFPLALYLLASYLLSGNKRWYWALIFVSGIAMFGHYASAGAFILPASVILLLLGERQISSTLWQRIKETIFYLVLTNIFAIKLAGQNAILEVLQSIIHQAFTRFNSTMATAAPASSEGLSAVQDGAKDIANFYKNQVWTLYTDTHQFLFWLLLAAALLFIIAFLVGAQRRKMLGSFAWLLVAGYSFLHVYLNANGISFLAQGWYRAFWHFPIALGLSAAALIGTSQKALINRFKPAKIPLYVVIGSASAIVVVFIFVKGDVKQFISLIDTRSSPASAHPEAINLVHDQKELNSLKNDLVPAWLPVSNKNYRMFTSDAQVNVWWSALFDLPLDRGYLDAPGDVGYHFLLDQAVGGDGLVKNFYYSPDSAKNMALYYLDWYAVKYGEGGHLSKSPNKSYSTYLEDVIDKKAQVGVKGAYLLFETASGKPEIKDDVVQYLDYYKFKDEIVSPVALISTAPTLLCICDRPTHESLNKILGLNNINSRYLINVYENATVDSFSLATLRQFDVVMLANYNYHDKSRTYKLLNEYLSQGGKIIMDTGGETPESDGRDVSNLLPFAKLSRKGLGGQWDISLNHDSQLTSQLDWSQFSPPMYDKVEWNISFPEGDVQNGTEVLASQAGKPIIIRKPIGKGMLIWSGMNLAYHVQYYTNVAESKFVLSLINSLVELKPHEYTEGAIKYNSSGNFTFTTPNSGKGVLLKLQRWQNWQVNVNGRITQTFAAGPSFPGFIYIPLKESGAIKVDFKYWGYPEWYIWTFISVITGIILLDLSVFNGFILMRHVSKLSKRGRKRMSGWWEKEENE